jgi:hypothetical protein
VKLYTLARPARHGETPTTGAKPGEWVHLTAGGHFSTDDGKAVCFQTEPAALMYLRHLPWKRREALRVVSLGTGRD